MAATRKATTTSCSSRSSSPGKTSRSRTRSCTRPSTERPTTSSRATPCRCTRSATPSTASSYGVLASSRRSPRSPIEYAVYPGHPLPPDAPPEILAVPLIDTGFSFLRRVVQRRSFSSADREHLHHRLMRLGHGPRRAVLILCLWTALASAAAAHPDVHQPRGNWCRFRRWPPLALLLFTYFHPRLRRRDDDEDAVQRRPGRPGERRRGVGRRPRRPPATQGRDRLARILRPS